MKQSTSVFAVVLAIVFLPVLAVAKLLELQQ